ncbi:MAG: hypothetical protein JRI68_01060 [Deltaproteobacteria bacterium]|nr:hypothetical protein [Deltaproteobacteria bacterium]
MAKDQNQPPCAGAVPERIHVVAAVPTRLTFADTYFELTFDGDVVTIAGPTGQVTLRQKSQQVAYKATLLGGFVVEEDDLQGTVDYDAYFFIDWEEEYAVPELGFKQPPERISRIYRRGQRIELGVEKVSLYCVQYSDGVEAQFERRQGTSFDFFFSTGLYGSFHQDEDDSYTLKFKGDRMEKGEDDLHAQSKFIVSRSMYSGMLLLILQEDAVVLVA